MNPPDQIWLANTQELTGGAARIAQSLRAKYQEAGIHTRLWVAEKESVLPDVFSTRRSDGFPGKYWRWRRKLLEELGWDDFHFPGSHELLDALKSDKKIAFHFHNLHGGYFDLRLLPLLSANATVVLTLHDAWLLSGHCAHSFECERWKTGCGECPDLTIPPAIARDGTAFNWRRKKALFSKSKLKIATPCRWLADKVEASLLASPNSEVRVIPNGVDLTLFQPSNKTEAKRLLGLDPHTPLVVFASNGLRGNRWKDIPTLLRTIKILSEGPRSVQLVAIGEHAPELESLPVRTVPYIHQLEGLTKYYQAADLYFHPALAETFPNVILEAMSCGTPVVASRVGGIPEQVEDLRESASGTGAVFKPSDAHDAASLIQTIFDDPNLQQRLGQNARRRAESQFDLNTCAKTYLDWISDDTKS